MLIRELETKTGLERATIRYYEKEGLITPHREENGYRTYSDADLDMLLKIKLLRQLGMPLDKIKEIQQGSAEFSDALTIQIATLERQIADSGRAKEVCIDIKCSGTTFRELDAQYYLNALSQPKQEEQKWTPQPVPEFTPLTPIHPWKRFFARMIDLSIMEMTMLFFVSVILRVRPLNDFIYTVLGLSLVNFILWIPIEGLLLHYWGTTPGKWIFGIRVESCNGGPLSAVDATKRAFDILGYGYGFTIPIYTLWRHFKCYTQYLESRTVQWDVDRNAEVQFDYKYSFSKKCGIFCIIAAYLLVFGIYVADSIKPTHRGEDLTISQIAENHNDLVDQLYENPSDTMYLFEDGTWNSRTDNYGSVTVVIGTKPVGEENNYQYKIENGYVRTITYDQTWTDIFSMSPIGTKATITIKSIAFAQDWLNVWNGSEFENILNEALKEPSGEFVYENLEIRWMTEAENCKLLGGSYYTDNEELPSFMSLKMEIKINDIP